MELYIIRHGKTYWNEEKRIQGWADIDLTESGRRVAVESAEGMKNIHFDAIYSSPLKRAYQTAEAINSFRNLTVEIHEDLIEINGGDWEGHYWRDLPGLFPEDTVLWNTRPYDFAPKNGEPMRHVYERMKCAVLEIVEKNQGKQICITSHGCAIRNFLCWAMGKPIEKINEVDWCDNTAVSIIDFNDAFEPTAVLANDASHLSGETSTFSKQTWWKPENRIKTEWDEEMFQ